MTTEYFKRLEDKELDAIDAAVFSGDIFANAENRKQFKFYLSRWLREMNLLEALDNGAEP
jgi:hypothetical protein